MVDRTLKSSYYYYNCVIPVFFFSPIDAVQMAAHSRSSDKPELAEKKTTVSSVAAGLFETLHFRPKLRYCWNG